VTLIQRLILKLLPKRWSTAIRAESEEWVLTCEGCGTVRSLWEMGGVRYKGTSRDKRTLIWCGQCNQIRWMKVERKRAS
jgi:RNase P subunit RPR2